MSRWEISTAERLLQKRQRLGMLTCLLDEHTASLKLRSASDEDVEYIRGLKARITSVKSQIRNMGCEVFGDD